MKTSLSVVAHRIKRHETIKMHDFINRFDILTVQKEAKYVDHDVVDTNHKVINYNNFAKEDGLEYRHGKCTYST